MQQKNIQSTKKAPKRAKKNAQQQRSELNSGYSWRQIPITQERLNRLAQDMEDWAVTTEEIYLNRFWLGRRMTKDSFENLLDKSERLRSAYKFAKEVLGVKREEKIHKGEADRQTISWRQPVYSQEVKEVEEWRSTLKEKENKAGAGDFVIEQVPVPNSDMVPPKQKED